MDFANVGSNLCVILRNPLGSKENETNIIIQQ